MNHPISKGFIFLCIPIIHYLFDTLNYSQAGKTGILGFFVITTLFYWKNIFPNKNKILTLLIAIASILILIFMSFQMMLRDIFSVQQDNILVIEAMFNTNTSESKEFFIQYKSQILKHAVISILTILLFLTIVFKTKVQSKKKYFTGFVVFTFLTILIHFNPTMRRSNPLFYFPIYYVKWNNDLIATQNLTAKIEDEIKVNFSVKYDGHADQQTVVWVIGESDTRNNWGLYGYPRQTTPLLSKHKELLIFKNILSADSGTVGSLSKMLTPATLIDPNLWKKSPDLLSIAKAAGYKVFWLSNHGTDKRGVLSIFASHADKTSFTNKGTSRGESTFDEALFSPYQKALEDGAKRKLIIVHIMGSHPAYNFRYPKKYNIYSLSTKDSITQKLKNEGRSKYAIVFRNQYDNAITYQDFILSNLLEKLQHKNSPNSTWLYIADHGQDVSHHTDHSGHNHKVKEMWEVPMLLWESENRPKNKPLPPLSIKYQADVIDHTILGLLNISGSYYDPKEDLFNTY